MKRYNSQQQHSDNQRHDSQSNFNESNQQNQDYFQILLQNYLQNSQNIRSFNPGNTGSASSGPFETNNINNHHEECSNQMISSLFQIAQQQTQQLEALIYKVQHTVGQNKQMSKRIKELQLENQILKSKDNKRQQPQHNWKQPINQIKIQGQFVTKQSLINILFGKQKYEYKLGLLEPLDQPLYRERNFNIMIELLDLNNIRVANSNKIPMSLALYTCQNPPKFIQKNTAGQKMLKGYVDQSLMLGTCHFQKVQIRQVTSHYRSGWIFLVAIPCMTPLGANKSQNFVDYTKIKPLVIQQVVVKAKKPKKKDEKKEQSQGAAQ